MNKRQKGQVIFAALFAALFIWWLFSPGWTKIFGLIYSVLGFLLIVLSYHAEEKKEAGIR